MVYSQTLHRTNHGLLTDLRQNQPRSTHRPYTEPAMVNNFVETGREIMWNKEPKRIEVLVQTIMTTENL